MSRVGRRPIPVPSSVRVDVMESVVRVKGAAGELTQALPPGIRAEIRGAEIHMVRPNDEPGNRALHGLARALLANAVAGVQNRFVRKLEIIGIGYRAAVANGVVTFNLGYSHAIDYPVPDGVEVTIEKQTAVTIRGADKQVVGRVAAEMRDLKRPDVYKGKGVRYEGEKVRQKVGKTGA